MDLLREHAESVHLKLLELLFDEQSSHNGHAKRIWQARYYSCPLGENHLWNAMVYVETNPVRVMR